MTRRRGGRRWLCLALGSWLGLAVGTSSRAADLTVGSKNFAESRLNGAAGTVIYVSLGLDERRLAETGYP